jgi:hypothetical protein
MRRLRPGEGRASLRVAGLPQKRRNSVIAACRDAARGCRDYLYRYREPNISIKPDDAVRCIEDSTKCRTSSVKPAQQDMRLERESVEPISEHLC